MADSSESTPRADDSSVKVYARIRQIMPWEDEKLGIKWTDKTITNYGLNNASRQYKFTQALPPEMDNKEVFDGVIRPLIDRVLDGYNSLVIAYGQTGAGKTYTLLGKPKLGVTGMLTQSLVEFLENKNVKEIRLRAMEAYGVKPARIELFDLLNEQNHTGNWSSKQGNSMAQIESSNTSTVIIKTKQDCFDIIQRAQQSSHFAPTGKNPESSRGHIVFVIDVKGENENNEEISSSMVFADLAGSEGDSALTDEFIASVTQETLLARKLEGGVINVGLSELQLIFRNLMKKGGLSKSSGAGLIRMIKPYINSNTFISVVFCLSPSFINCASTEATLKFAAQACRLKTSPAKAQRKINYENMAARLKQELQEQTSLVEKLQHVIASALTEDESSVLIQKIKEADLLKLFDINEKSISEPSTMSRKNTSRKNRVASPRLDRVKSEAMLAVESAEEEEKSWHVSRKNRKHRRMFSKHIDANQLTELAETPLSPAFEVDRNDAIVVQELLQEADENESTRSWIAVMSQSLYSTHRGMNTRVSAWGANLEAFFSKVAKTLFASKYEDSSENIQTQKKPSFKIEGDTIAPLPFSPIAGDTDFSDVMKPPPLAHGESAESRGGEMMSMASVRSLQFDQLNSSGSLQLDDVETPKTFHRVDTEDVMRLDARE